MATDTLSDHHHRKPAGVAAKTRAVQTEIWLSSTLLFTVTIVLYWVTRTHLNTFDAVSYANQISHLFPRTHDRHWLFHPHHLLFNALGYVLWQAARSLGYAGGPLVVLQTLNSILGATGIVLFYQTLRRLMQRSHWLPFLLSCGLALSFGYWICATDGRVNMPSTVLMLAAFLKLCQQLERPTQRRAAAIGGLAGLAFLFHESAGLFVVVGLAGILLAEYDTMLLPTVRLRQRRATIGTYLGTWLAVVTIPYLIVGTIGLHLFSLGAFHHWMTSYSELGWWWNFQILHNLRLDAYALRHAAFVEPPGKQGTFHLSHAIPLALRTLYFATLAGWFVGIYAFIAALPLLWRSHQRRIMIICILWIALYGAFFTVWSPGYFVFWVPVLVPISVLVATSLAHYRARRGGLWVNWVVGTWIGLYAVLNFQASILPHCRADASPFQREAHEVHAHTQFGDLVLVAGAGDGAQFEVDIPYFANRDVLSLHTLLTRRHDDRDAALTQAQAQIAQTLASGHDVYALDELRQRRTLDALSKRHPEWDASAMSALLAPYTRTLAWTGPRGPVWRLTLPPMSLEAPHHA